MLIRMKLPSDFSPNRNRGCDFLELYIFFVNFSQSPDLFLENSNYYLQTRLILSEAIRLSYVNLKNIHKRKFPYLNTRKIPFHTFNKS